MLSLRPDVSNKDSLAVASDRVLKEVSELALTIGDVVTLGITGRDHHLLQVGQRPVDVSSFLLGKPLSTSLLNALITSQVNQVKLRVNHLLT